MTKNKRPFDRLRRMLFGAPWDERNATGKLAAVLTVGLAVIIVSAMVLNAYTSFAISDMGFVLRPLIGGLIVVGAVVFVVSLFRGRGD